MKLKPGERVIYEGRPSPLSLPLRYLTTRYTLTNRRLHISRGVFSREVQEIRLERVRRADWRQSAYQRVFAIGDIHFDTDARDDYRFAFLGIPRPEKIVAELGELNGNGVETGGLA
jgi:membrane protein YdbS with pleckstrin-like domain